MGSIGLVTTTSPKHQVDICTDKKSLGFVMATNITLYKILFTELAIETLSVIKCKRGLNTLPIPIKFLIRKLLKLKRNH